MSNIVNFDQKLIHPWLDWLQRELEVSARNEWGCDVPVLTSANPNQLRRVPAVEVISLRSGLDAAPT